MLSLVCYIYGKGLIGSTPRLQTGEKATLPVAFSVGAFRVQQHQVPLETTATPGVHLPYPSGNTVGRPHTFPRCQVDSQHCAVGELVGRYTYLHNLPSVYGDGCPL